LSSLPEKLRKSARGIGDVGSQLLLLKAQAVGVAVTASIIDAMTTKERNLAGTVDDAYAVGKAGDQIQAFKDKIDSAAKAFKMLNDIASGGTGTGTGAGGGSTDLSKLSKLTIARMQQELDLLKTKRDTINDTNNELKRQYDYQMKLMNLQKDQTQAKISGDYIGASILGQQKSFERSEFNKETAALALDKQITTLENRISALQAGARVSAAESAVNKARAKGKAMGGLIVGPGTGRSDSIMAGFAYGGLPQLTVSNGEYIVQSRAVQKYGVGFMDAVNQGKVSSPSQTAQQGNTVYNIDMTINGGNSNPNEIADQVIRRLKVETSKNNKTNKVAF
jgi:hypothetical protein